MHELLQDVQDHYRALKGKVPATSDDKALTALRKSLPEALTSVALIGGTRNIADYKIYGGCGQLNFSFARVPWVACCRRSVSDSVQRGYFIVLLFREDMRGVYLSLNQGYQQYYDNFADDQVSRRKSTRVGADLASRVPMPEGFVSGPINLGATNGLGWGYEAGAIFSRFYPADAPANSIAQDFKALLEAYDALVANVGPLTATDVPVSDADFQAAANREARKDTLPIIGPGPQEKQPPAKTSRGGGWRRKPAVAALAIRKAGFKCEVVFEHQTFVSRSSGKNFVEAHHLIPMQVQADFKYSLDVPENVVALCPNCHRSIHHGLNDERWKTVQRLMSLRASDLKGRGVSISDPDLKAIYTGEIVDELM